MLLFRRYETLVTLSTCFSHCDVIFHVSEIPTRLLTTLPGKVVRAVCVCVWFQLCEMFVCVCSVCVCGSSCVKCLCVCIVSVCVVQGV